MKVLFQTILIAAVVFVLFGQSSEAQFRKGGNWLGPVVTLATDPIGFGVNFEHAMSQNVGIGALVRYWGQSVNSYGADWSWSIIMPQLQVAYHFMPGDQLDPYAGGRLGWAIYDNDIDNDFISTSSDLFLNLHGGLRYFFNPKISANGSIEFRLAGTDYFGGSLGLTVGADFTL